jgi:hypothetical protein
MSLFGELELIAESVLPLKRSQPGQQRMEPLWSPVDATSGSRLQAERR